MPRPTNHITTEEWYEFCQQAWATYDRNYCFTMTIAKFFGMETEMFKKLTEIKDFLHTFRDEITSITAVSSQPEKLINLFNLLINTNTQTEVKPFSKWSAEDDENILYYDDSDSHADNKTTLRGHDPYLCHTLIKDIDIQDEKPIIKETYENFLDKDSYVFFCYTKDHQEKHFYICKGFGSPMGQAHPIGLSVADGTWSYA